MSWPWATKKDSSKAKFRQRGAQPAPTRLEPDFDDDAAAGAPVFAKRLATDADADAAEDEDQYAYNEASEAGGPSAKTKLQFAAHKVKEDLGTPAAAEEEVDESQIAIKPKKKKTAAFVRMPRRARQHPTHATPARRHLHQAAVQPCDLFTRRACMRRVRAHRRSARETACAPR